MKIRFISLLIVISLMQGFFNKSFAQSDTTKTEETKTVDSKSGILSDVLSNVVYGVELGLNTSSFNSSYSKYGVGVSIGVLATYPISDMLSISGGVAYVRRNARDIDQNILFNTGNPMFSADYVRDVKTNINLQNVASTIKANLYPFSFDNGIKPRVFIGYSAEYILFAEAINNRSIVYEERNAITNSLDEVEENTITKSIETERFKYFDHSVLIGLGTDIDIDDKILTVDFGYKLGVRNINNVTSYQPFRVNAFELLIGLKF